MPLAQQIFLIAVAALAIGLALYFAFRPRRWSSDENLDPKYRDGPTLQYGRDTPRVEELRADAQRSAFHPAPDSEEGFHRRKELHRDDFYSRPRFKAVPLPTGGLILLSPRHLEHVNIRRRHKGKEPLNANGFRTAIARQSNSAPIRTSSEWLAYLIAYEVLSREHQQGRVACEHTIAIEPDSPFNGQGGRFAGAGATSSFDTPVSDPAADRDEPGRAATRGLLYGSAGAFAAGAALAGVSPSTCDDYGPAGAPHVFSRDPSDGNPEAYSPPQSDPPAAQPQPQPDPPAYQAPDPPAYQAPDPPSGGGTVD